jgi:hypothetical protein
VEVRYWGERVFRGVVTPSLTLVLDKEARGVQTTIFSKDAAEQQGDLIAGQPWNFSPASELIERLRAAGGSTTDGSWVTNLGPIGPPARANTSEFDDCEQQRE